jgi:hypothetical protein
MKKYKIYHWFLSLAMLFLLSHTIGAQQNKTIAVEYGKLIEVIFTSAIDSTVVSLPNSFDYYDIKRNMENRSLTIEPKKENTPAFTLHVVEKNGTIWALSIEYKKDIDEADFIYNFADNDTENKSGIKNTVLTLTEERDPLKKQGEAIPFTDPELSQLSAANHGIDFSIDPPEQTRNLADAQMSPAFADSVYQKRATLNRAYKDRDGIIMIRLICEDIIFSDNNGYLKLLIQNNSDEDFFTGNMILSLVRTNGSVLRLHPGDIYPKKFPVIKPKFQKAIIYSFKAYEVSDEDSLKFEIRDRKQKINLEFNIPGFVYNEEKKRY